MNLWKWVKTTTNNQKINRKIKSTKSFDFTPEELENRQWVYIQNDYVADKNISRFLEIQETQK